MPSIAVAVAPTLLPSPSLSIGIVERWVLKLLDRFHEVITSFIVHLGIALNAFQQITELCGVTGFSYVKDLILKLGYLTFVAGFCPLISPIVELVSVLLPGFCHLCLILFRHSYN